MSTNSRLSQWKKLYKKVLPTQKAKKFLIIYSYKNESSKQKVIQSAFAIENRMILLGFSAWGQESNMFEFHIQTSFQNSKVDVQATLKQAFEDYSYEYLMIFYIGDFEIHNHKTKWFYTMKIYDKKSEKDLELRTVLNMWKPKSIKHLAFIADGYDKEFALNVLQTYKYQASINMLVQISSKNVGKRKGISIIKSSFLEKTQDIIENEQQGLLRCPFIASLLDERQLPDMSNEDYRILQQKRLYFTQSDQNQNVSSVYFGLATAYTTDSGKTLKTGLGMLQTQLIFYEGMFEQGSFHGNGRLHSYRQETLSTEQTVFCKFNKSQRQGPCLMIYDLADRQNATNHTLCQFFNYPLPYELTQKYNNLSLKIYYGTFKQIRFTNFTICESRSFFGNYYQRDAGQNRQLNDLRNSSYAQNQSNLFVKLHSDIYCLFFYLFIIRKVIHILGRIFKTHQQIKDILKDQKYQNKVKIIYKAKLKKKQKKMAKRRRAWRYEVHLQKQQTLPSSTPIPSSFIPASFFKQFNLEDWLQKMIYGNQISKNSYGVNLKCTLLTAQKQKSKIKQNMYNFRSKRSDNDEFSFIDVRPNRT